MTYFEDFCGIYSLSKTLRFELIPMGKTSDHLLQAREEGKRKAEAYKRVKVKLDELHREYINNILNEFASSSDEFECNGFCHSKLEGIYELFVALKKGQEGVRQTFEQKKKELMNDASKFITKRIPKNILDELKNRVDDEDLKNDVTEFDGYRAYFSGYDTSREYIYKERIPARVIENLAVHLGMCLRTKK